MVLVAPAGTGTVKPRSSRLDPASRLGTWVLTSRLHEGRWASVYRACPVEHDGDSSDYVVKALRETMQNDPVALAALRREAHIGSIVIDPHLAPVLSCSVMQPPYFLVLPYLQGNSLAEIVYRDGRLPVVRALWIVRQLAQALRQLHRHGWIHADVKPSNIIVSPQGHATLIDFGLCRRANTAECHGERPFVGTLAYAAPEMMTACMPITYSADVYGLGITLYELLTGQLPFAARDPRQLARAHLVHRPTDIRRLAPQVPDGVVQLLQRMLAKEALRRPNDDELISSLVRLEIDLLEGQVSQSASGPTWNSRAASLQPA